MFNQIRETAKQHILKAGDPSSTTSYSGEQVNTFIEMVVTACGDVFCDRGNIDDHIRNEEQ